VVKDLRWAALEELVRWGTHPDLVAWLQNEGEPPFPREYAEQPGPPGYTGYMGRINRRW